MQLARFVVPVVLGFVTTPAIADDEVGAEAEGCTVHVIRAPAAVRAALEARIGIESACVTLDVRVIPTRDGYYVIATQPLGESFEGSVRDPGQVGELVIGWARLPPPVEPAPAPIVAAPPPRAAPVVEVREQP